MKYLFTDDSRTAVSAKVGRRLLEMGAVKKEHCDNPECQPGAKLTPVGIMRTPVFPLNKDGWHYRATRPTAELYELIRSLEDYAP